MSGKNSRKSRRNKAIEHYEKFLDLWKDADPGIAEVDVTCEGEVGEAEKRLAGLREMADK